MTTPSYVLLYVENPTASADVYARLFGRAPVEASPGFVLFVLENGLKIGLWKRPNVEPGASVTGGGAELAFPVAAGDRAAVDALHADWAASGLPIAQGPTAMDFGYTFVALDPDGHRLRVFAPTA